MPTALLTGVTGQDGAYLSELLLSKLMHPLIPVRYRRTNRLSDCRKGFEKNQAGSLSG